MDSSSHFEDVPLSDLRPVTSFSSDDTLLPAAVVPRRHIETQETIDSGAWNEAYKNAMGVTIAQMLALAVSPHWELVDSPSGGDETISLFEDVSDPSFVCLKATGIVAGRADRFLYILKDHDPETRLAWDGKWFTRVQQLETYVNPEEGDLTVVASCLRSPVPMLFSDRSALGIQWTGYDSLLKTHKLVYTTVNHPIFKHPEGMARVHLSMLVVLREIDNDKKKKKKQTEITLVVKTGPPPPALSLIDLGGYKETIREQIHLFERVVANWAHYYGPTRDPKKIENRK